MEENLFKINWDQIRMKTTAQWIRMNDYDLLHVDKTTFHSGKFVGMLGDQYSPGSDMEENASIIGQEKKEIAKRLAQMEAEQNIIVNMHKSAI